MHCFERVLNSALMKERIRGVFTHNALYKSTFYYVLLKIVLDYASSAIRRLCLERNKARIPRRRHRHPRRHPREDRREDVGVGVGFVECGLYRSTGLLILVKDVINWPGRVTSVTVKALTLFCL